MFYIIGLGLSDEKDITLRGLEVPQFCPTFARVHFLLSYHQHRLLGLQHVCTLKHIQASSLFKKSAWHVISPGCPFLGLYYS